MRTIKFRAWDKDTGRMRTMDNPTYTVSGHPFKTREFGDLQWFFGEFTGDYELLQYTGLKDKNGVEIYEGDVVRVDGHNYKVVWGYQQCSFYLGIINTVSALQMYKALSGEVIGNIYENKELLK